MKCLVCNKLIPDSDTSITVEGNFVHVTSACHGALDTETYTLSALKRIEESGRDMASLPTFRDRGKRIDLIQKPKDPESMVSLKDKLKKLLNEFQPGWYRSGMPWSDTVVDVVQSALTRAREYDRATADLHQLIGIAESAVNSLVMADGPDDPETNKMLALHQRAIQRIKEGLKK